MRKYRTSFVCQNCGASHTRWSGKCDACEEWNTLVEENSSNGIGGNQKKGSAPGKGRILSLTNLSEHIEETPRISSGITELDRATGGGFVRGSVLLVGGDPGIGKSTLLMQVAASLSEKGKRVIYVSGEEAATQVKLRARRLDLAHAPVEFAAETNVEDILATVAEGKKPDLVILDSIQTLWTECADSSPGTVTQARASTQAVVAHAKSNDIAFVLVGHVTKEGQIAGPRVIEHMVDAVLYFEGDGKHHYRILRAIKNRFGPTNEIGMFEMCEKGLREISNPSELFLSDRHNSTPGTAVFGGMEGTRPILAEIQALVSPSNPGTARRVVVGWDPARLAMILAVLETHCKMPLSTHDVYLSVAGGYRITEPAADLAVAAALISSLTGLALPADCVYFGEIGLSGSLRPVSHAQQRLREAEKLGFSSAFFPRESEEKSENPTTIQICRLNKLIDLAHNICNAKKTL